jgi:hypothetical protein
MMEGTVQTTWPSEALLSLWATVQITDYDDDGPLLRADDIGKMRAEVLRVKAEMVALRSRLDEAEAVIRPFAEEGERLQLPGRLGWGGHYQVENPVIGTDAYIAAATWLAAAPQEQAR